MAEAKPLANRLHPSASGSDRSPTGGTHRWAMDWRGVAGVSLMATLAIGIGLGGSGVAEPSGSLHALFEWTALGVALFTATLCFVHYSLTRNALAALIGVAVVCAGAMDAFVAATASSIVIPAAPAEAVMDFTWSLGRGFQALVLVFGTGLIWLRAQPGAVEQRRMLGGVALATSLSVAAAIGYCVTATTLPPPLLATGWTARPLDAASLLVFGFAATLLYPTLKERHGGEIWLESELVPAQSFISR